MRLAAFRVRLHMRFYLVLILVVLTLLTAMATGFGLVTKLLNTLLLVMALSYFWNWLTVTSLEVKVDRLTRKAQVGDTIEEVMIVRNQLGIPKHALEVEDRTDLPGYSGGMVLSLSGNATRYWRVRTTARKRGVYTLGPVRIANTDPFGLFRRERLLGHTDTVTVYPRTFSLPGFEIPSADLLGESSVRKRTHHVTPHASSVREYAFGDSLSRVHWNSTAKLGKLMSKVFDLGHAGEVWVLVDLHRDIQAGEMEESTDEYAVTVGASLAKKYLEAQLPVGLIAHGDQRYYLIAETGAGQMNRILQFLAMSKAEGRHSPGSRPGQGGAAVEPQQHTDSNNILPTRRVGRSR